MALIETETTTSANVHVMKCTVCGHTCEQVNGDYDYCPHCGDFVGTTIYEQYFSTPSAIAYNWQLLKDILYGLTFPEKVKMLNKPYKNLDWNAYTNKVYVKGEVKE